MLPTNGSRCVLLQFLRFAFTANNMRQFKVSLMGKKSLIIEHPMCSLSIHPQRLYVYRLSTYALTWCSACVSKIADNCVIANFTGQCTFSYIQAVFFFVNNIVRRSIYKFLHMFNIFEENSLLKIILIIIFIAFLISYKLRFFFSNCSI